MKKFNISAQQLQSYGVENPDAVVDALGGDYRLELFRNVETGEVERGVLYAPESATLQSIAQAWQSADTSEKELKDWDALLTKFKQARTKLQELEQRIAAIEGGA